MASIESIESSRPAKAGKLNFKKLLGGITAAAVLGATVLVTLLFQKPTGPAKVADWYIRDNLIMLPSAPDTTSPVQAGIDLYNGNRLPEARQRFQQLLRADSLHKDALLYEGIVSLRLDNYDDALGFFAKLQTHTDPHTNPALFYQALTLLRRSHDKDVNNAKQLLQRIVQENLNMKADAEELLKKL